MIGQGDVDESEEEGGSGDGVQDGRLLDYIHSHGEAKHVIKESHEVYGCLYSEDELYLFRMLVLLRLILLKVLAIVGKENYKGPNDEVY